jgi:hypothetical protein
MTVAAGQPATFIAGASGTPTPSVQWQVSTDGGATWSDIAGATSGTLTVPSTTRSESGDEGRAVFTNSAGSATTNVVTLTVHAADDLTAVTAVWPDRGRPGSLVLIFGHRLRSVKKVDFGSSPAVYMRLTNWLIVALAPDQGASGPVDVTVDSRDGESATSTSDEFTYEKRCRRCGRR